MKERSPRFPFVPLRAALGQLKKIHEASEDGRITRSDAIVALGADKPNGRLHRLLAAMRGYGLLASEDKGVFNTTPLGRRLLQTPDSKANGPWLKAARDAALNPPVFRRIWRKVRHMEREQLEQALLLRGFTEAGATRAAEVFSRNRLFAALDQMPSDDDFAPDQEKRDERRRQRGQGALQPARAAARSAVKAPPGPPRDAVVLPLGNKRAIIPTGISAADYDLLIDTLQLWKGRIVRSGSPV